MTTAVDFWMFISGTLIGFGGGYMLGWVRRAEAENDRRNQYNFVDREWMDL